MGIFSRNKSKVLDENYAKIKVAPPPSSTHEIPIVSPKEDVSYQLDATTITTASQLNQFRQLSEDKNTQYSAYDEMKSDPIIAAALELYADDATQYDEQGRIIWAESDDPVITKAANRLLDILNIPERSWKHIYQLCTYGDYYLKLYKKDSSSQEENSKSGSNSVRVINDKVTSTTTTTVTPYEEYVEDVEDPATVFELRKRGRTAGFISVNREAYSGLNPLLNNANFVFQIKDIEVFPADRFIHIMLGENLTRVPETLTIKTEESTEEYSSVRGKSMLHDVYPIQKELQLLEDSLLLNRLTRSSLIRMLEVEVGDMPKQEINNYLRRVKSLIEQHISMDTSTGDYKSYNAPGPIDNIIYIPVRNGQGSISINNLGGDVNIRDIADIDYFNNKRSGALKIPRQFLGEDGNESSLSNGGSLTRLSIRYARTIKRIQTAYIRAVTQMLNLFFAGNKLDYINKFKIRMTSPSTQEDLDRAELISTNINVVSDIMDLTSSLEGSTQKKVLSYLINNIMKMPEIADIIDEDMTPEEDIEIQGGSSGFTPRTKVDIDLPDIDTDTLDITSSTPDSTEGGFSEEEFSEFQDELPN